jgi:hypothetical protein
VRRSNDEVRRSNDTGPERDSPDYRFWDRRYRMCMVRVQGAECSAESCTRCARMRDEAGLVSYPQHTGPARRGLPSYRKDDRDSRGLPPARAW